MKRYYLFIYCLLLGVTSVIGQTRPISGNVAMPCNNLAISDVTVTISDVNGTPISAETTDSNGNYTFDAIPYGVDYEITASKVEESQTNIACGIECDGADSDSYLIRQHLLGLTLFNNPLTIIASDSNSDGETKASDLLRLTKICQGIEVPPDIWRFVASDYQFLDPTNPLDELLNASKITITDTSNQSNNNFGAVKPGDVNCTYIGCEQGCECINGGELQVLDNTACNALFGLGGYTVDGCATLIEEFTWNFGDGSGDVITTSLPIIANHEYAENDTYTVTVSFNVKDNVTGDLCNVSYDTTLEIMDCDMSCECINGGELQVLDNTACNALFGLGGYAVDGCATLIEEFTWNFGDGSGDVITTSLPIIANHEYAENDTYTVTVSFNVKDNVTGDLCNVSYDTTLEIMDCDMSCECINGGELQVLDNTACNALFGLGGYAVDGCATLIEEFTWNFGDGSGDVITTSLPIIANHEYAENDTYTVTVSFNVKDNVTGDLCNVSYDTTIEIMDCDPPCSPPTNLQTAGTTLSWDPVPGAVGYIVEATPSWPMDCSCPWPISIVPIQTSATSVTLPLGFNNCTSVQVRTICADGSISDPSDGICVRFGHGLSSNVSVTSIAPNPNRGKMNIKVETSTDIQNISLKIYDFSGLLVNTIESLKPENGALDYNLDLSSQLRSGIYFFIFNIGDETITKQVIVK